MTKGYIDPSGGRIDVDGLEDGDAVKWNKGSKKLVKGDAKVNPVTKEWDFDKSVNVPAASVKIGSNLKLSDFGEILANTNIPTGTVELIVDGHAIEAEGILLPEVPTSPPSEQLAFQPLGTDISPPITEGNPFEFSLDPSLFTSSVPSDEFLIIENFNDIVSIPDNEQVRTEIWIGTDDTGHKIFDFNFTLTLGIYSFKPPSPQVFRAENMYFVRTSVTGTGDFTFRGIQAGPDFFQKLDIRGYPIQRSRAVTRKTMDSSPHNYLVLNDEGVISTTETTGLSVVYERTALVDTTSTGSFVPAEDGVSNPTLNSDGESTFSQDDIVLIENTNFNNGLYEVESHASNLLTVRGLGIVAKIEDFTRGNFINSVGGIAPSAFSVVPGEATITKVNISVIRSDITGNWEVAKGSKTPLAFTRVVLSKGVREFNTSISTDSAPIADIYSLIGHTGDVTLTLSSTDIASASLANPWIFTIQDISGTLETNGRILNVVTEGSETINGLPSISVGVDNGSVALFSDGTNLFTTKSSPKTKGTVVLIGQSTSLMQGPVALDTDYQIEFGPAQGGPSNPVQISAAGAVTINETSDYMFRLSLPISRTGTGGTAIIVFRALIDSGSGPEQFLHSVTTKIQNTNTEVSINPSLPSFLNAGDIVTFEIIRDSEGVNEGDLTGVDVTPISWANSPSASIVIQKLTKVY